MGRIQGLTMPALFGLLILISSCSVISKSVRQQADTSISFEALRQTPGGYTGRTVLLGGYILEVQNLSEKTKIMVLQTPLGSQDRPESRDRSQGRFVIMADGFLDPAVYKSDLGITVAGTVIGPEAVQIESHSYSTVAVNPVEIHLWEKETRPYYRGPYYDPFYYDPFYYDPFFYGPFYPWPGPHFLPRPHPRHRK